MRKFAAVLGVAGAMVAPGAAWAANPGADNASPCGTHHGMFGLPAHGALGPQVSDLASSGFYKGGTVGEAASNTRCHEVER